MPNRIECPRCGANTKIIYGPKGGYLRIKCSKPHVYVKKFHAKPDRETKKRNEVFFIELDPGELELYRNNELTITIKDYKIPATFKEGFKEKPSN